MRRRASFPLCQQKHILDIEKRTIDRDAGSTLGHRGSNFFKGHFWAWHTKKIWAWHIKNETLYSVNCERKLFSSAPVLNIFDK